MATETEKVYFENLALDARLVRAVKSMGFKDPTPVQEKSIPVILEGHDLMASAQTGTGKTAAYMLPIIHCIAANPRKSRGPLALVLTPTRELALQVAGEVEKFGKYIPNFRVCTVVGGVPYAKQIKRVRQGIDVLVATPGRLTDLMGSGRVDIAQVNILVLDEADRMLDMGFTQDVHNIAEATNQDRQTLLFSATLDGSVAQLARRLLQNAKRIEIAPEKRKTPAVSQSLHYADGQGHKSAVVKHILQLPEVDRTIIFTATKRAAENLAVSLSKAGFMAASLHGDMRQNQRNRTVESLRAGRVRVLVATDVAARGLDIDGISHVINYDMPKIAEDYIHRIGRTGRAGKTGTAVSLVTVADRTSVRQIETLVGRNIEVSLIPGLEPRNVSLFKALDVKPSRPNAQSFRYKSRGGRSRSRSTGSKW